MSEAALVASPGPWTVEDLTGLVDDGRRYEIVDGSLLVTPAPSLSHQAVAQRLAAVLNSCCAFNYETVPAPGLLLRQGPTTRLLVPDVAVVRSESLWSGAGTLTPDDVLLVAEIVSPSSQVTDRVTKPVLYADAGIAAYWLVDLVAPGDITVVLHRRTGASYVVEQTVAAGETVRLDWPLSCVLAPAELVGPRA